MKTTTRMLFAGALAAGCVPLAQAHPGHEGHDLTWDFQAGFQHPFSGVDHLLGLAAVGWWALQLGGRARWWVPAAFLAMMVVGGLVGAAVALPPPVLAPAIAASLLVVGVALAGRWRVSPVPAGVIAGTFAVLHGLAHGAEMPATAAASGYVAGFVAGSAVLLAAGAGLGIGARRAGVWSERVAGTACALAGCILLVA